ncbi:MAG: sugar phosphate nucleotidyltransferase [bacterium]
MKTIILCGGQGTRMKEETDFKPKPLVLVGGKPILWHIMKLYSHYGYNEFVLALGYKGHMIKEYFLRWQSRMNDFTLHTKENKVIFHNNECDDFKITFVETGLESLTGERILKLRDHITEDNFMVTYGDGVGDLDIKGLVDFHNQQDRSGTITAVHPKSRFGLLDIDHDKKELVDYYQHHVTHDMDEKSKDYINGGFMVFKRKVLDMIERDSMIEHIFAPLAQKQDLSVYVHPGTWKCMDTYKEAEEMNELWQNDPFWKVWN